MRRPLKVLTGTSVMAALIVALALAGPGGAVPGAAANLVRPTLLGTGVGNDALTSTNWSGYVVQSPNQFTDVIGSWTQPAVTCSLLDTAYSSFWVGIDGYGSGSVEQLGTDSDCSWTGSASYYAWWEMYPANSVSLSTTAYPVKPGDVFTAEVSRSGSSYTLSLKSSEGWTFSTNQGGSFANASAEWVAEAPETCQLIFCNRANLANFGSVAFSNAQAAAGPFRLPVSSFTTNGGPHRFTMVSNGTTEAQPSSLTGNGNAFTDTWFGS
jgi:peptidase A4-like protein